MAEYQQDGYGKTLFGYDRKEKAGTKVTFQILAVSAYGVYTFSEVYEYTVQEETDPEPMPNPEAN